jgi:hypothetical protein
MDEYPLSPFVRFRAFRSSLKSTDLTASTAEDATRNGYVATSQNTCNQYENKDVIQLSAMEMMPGFCPVLAAAAAKERVSLSRTSISWKRASICIDCAMCRFSYLRTARLRASSWCCKLWRTSAVILVISTLLLGIGPSIRASSSSIRCERPWAVPGLGWSNGSALTSCWRCRVRSLTILVNRESGRISAPRTYRMRLRSVTIPSLVLCVNCERTLCKRYAPNNGPMKHATNAISSVRLSSSRAPFWASSAVEVLPVRMVFGSSAWLVAESGRSGLGLLLSSSSSWIVSW